MKSKLKQVFLCLSVALFAQCKDEEPMEPEIIEQDTTPYAFQVGDFPAPNLPEDNPLTVQGVKLGRMLFYDTKLSADNSQSCASCHLQEFAFTDTARFSLGIRGMRGERQAMSVFNMAWNTNGFFWDGRAEILRHQALMPIQDPLEMDETLENVVSKLSEDQSYKDQFQRVFGSKDVNSERIALALEQFMNSIVSTNSRYDQFLKDSSVFNESEKRGFDLFFTEFNPFFPEASGADCEHCHGGINFENDQYMNNGLDTDAEMDDFGRQKATNNPRHKGQFKVTSLRNIAITPPYMHDGRFKTLEEVVEHYNSGIKSSSTLDPALEQVRPVGLGLSEQDKADLVAFLKTLTDQDLINNSAYSSPF
jgi:cytochrome c peroxidase